jgi:hypothetical protein
MSLKAFIIPIVGHTYDYTNDHKKFDIHILDFSSINKQNGHINIHV